MWNSCTSVSRILARGNSKIEIRQRNRGRRQEENVKMDQRKVGMKKSPDGLTILWSTITSGSLLSEAVDELPNNPNLHI